MPRQPLPNPERFLERLTSAIKGAPVVGFLGPAIVAINATQTASLVLRPFSPKAFRAYNRLMADTWWGWCVSAGKLFHDAHVVVTGDDVPEEENVIVILNHQSMTDIVFLMFFARSKGRLGDMKWMVKDIIKYVPGVGWGMLFLDCVFLKRDWAADRDSIKQTFAKLRDNRVPVWLLSFSEGTRITPEKLARSQDYARKHDFPLTRHVLAPRTKGFVATVEGLRDHITAVYDVTIGYESEGIPTLWQYAQGLAPSCRLHVRRHPIEELPQSEADLEAWIVERFQVKDELLEHFYREGVFPDEVSP